jgi:hypothetical protein
VRQQRRLVGVRAVLIADSIPRRYVRRRDDTTRDDTTNKKSRHPNNLLAVAKQEQNHKKTRSNYVHRNATYLLFFTCHSYYKTKTGPPVRQ